MVCFYLDKGATGYPMKYCFGVMNVEWWIVCKFIKFLLLMYLLTMVGCMCFITVLVAVLLR